MSKGQRVAVVGAGIIGVSTAVNIQLTCPDVEVTLISAKFSPDTTSDGAAGFVEPYMAPGTPQEDVARWFMSTWDHLDKLILGPDAGKAGVHFISGYNIFHEKVPDPHWKDLVIGFRQVSQTELNKYFPAFKHGWFFTSIICESHRYIPFLMEKFQKKGGTIIKRKIDSFAELSGRYDVVVNCTGVASRFLASDNSVEPVRGQIIKIKAPFLQHFYIYNLKDGTECYLLLWQEDVVLGGTAQVGRWDTEVDPKDAKEIWDRACSIIPSLKNTKILEHWVGLRPQRTKGVRVEAETMMYGSERVKVVHNYGHGGCGITLHWGCAEDAARLVRRELSTMPASRL